MKSQSLGQKILQIEGLLGTKDITDWQEDFITNIVERTDHGKHTTLLSTKQVDTIETIYGRHFA